MPFWFALPDVNGARDNATETQLVPAPAKVAYPDGAAGTRIETINGTVIVQQPSRDNRVREWIWENYPEWYVNYQTLWNQIQPLRSRYRYSATGNPYIFLKEDETKLLRKIAVAPTTGVVTPTYDWFKVRVIEVSRQLRSEGTSMVRYDQTKLVFVIEDANHNDLG